MESDELKLIQTELFGVIFLLAQHLTRLADANLEHLGLTSRQWLLLAVLAKQFAGQNPTLSEAALVYGSSRQNIKQIALQLQEAGFLQLLPDQADRRALRLHLTDKIAVFNSPEELARVDAFMEGLFQGLNETEQTQLHRLLQRWLLALAPDIPRTTNR
jgi:DNA-binding MarR family transcriptional regulator